MTCIFNDDDHAKIADDFEEALREHDIAELQHPVYGIKKVIPTGDIERDEDFTELLNETHVKITFTETITDEPTKPVPVLVSELEKKYESFCDNAASDFVSNIKTENINEQMSFQSVLENQKNIIDEQLTDYFVSGVNSKNQSSYADYLTSMNELKYNAEKIFSIIDKTIDKVLNLPTLPDIPGIPNIPNLPGISNKPGTINIDNIIDIAKKLINPGAINVTNALNTARLILNILNMPVKSINNLSETLKGYTTLAGQIMNSYKTNPYGNNNNNNTFTLTRLVLSGAVASISTGFAMGVVSKVNEAGRENKSAYLNVISRESIINSVIQINNLLSSVKDFEDSKIEKNDFIDNNATTYLTLIEIVNISAQIILNTSLSLPMRKTIKLERDRNIIELCAEIYESVDNYYIDKFIIENNINIDELEIIPMGREVSYYV
jgi:prophage DNA circulation protein